MQSSARPLSARRENASHDLPIATLIQAGDLGQAKCSAVTMAAILNRSQQAPIAFHNRARGTRGAGIRENRVAFVGTPWTKQPGRMEKMKVDESVRRAFNRREEPETSVMLNDCGVDGTDIMKHRGLFDPSGWEWIGTVQADFLAGTTFWNHPDSAFRFEDQRVR